MNEQFVVQFLQDDEPVPLTQLVAVELDRGGVVLNGETSAWPRGLRLGFDGVGGTQGVLRDLRLQTANGKHRFSLGNDTGALTITTAMPNRIPTGTYDLTLRVADLDVHDSVSRISLNEGAAPTRLTFQIRAPKQAVALSDSILADEPIAGIVNGNSRIDGRRIIDWLATTAPRAKRKACLLNLLAMLRTTPTPDVPLISNVQNVFLADVDRIYARVDPRFLDALDELAADPQQPFSIDGGPIHPTHLKLLRRIPLEDQDATEQYRLRSFRQDGQPSVQIVVAIPPNDGRQRGTYADIDIDLGNPKRDLAGFFVHLGEVISEGQTDHFKLRKRLAQNPLLSRHLHYTIEKIDGSPL